MPRLHVYALGIAVGLTALAPMALASRSARPAERAGVVAVLAPAFRDAKACFSRDTIRVSTVSSQWALYTSGAVGQRVRMRRTCLVGDGYIVLRKRPGGPWSRVLDSGWDGFAPCGRVPARVARDLTKFPCAQP